MYFYRIYYLILALLILIIFSCNNPNSSTLFTLQPATSTGINFTNSVTNSKDFNILSYRNFYNGGGCAIGDINNDGLPDVYFTANQGSNKLYLNKGNFAFTDITNQAGVADSTQWSTGVVMIDINHDGWLDIYVCNAGYVNNVPPVSHLFINNKNNTFSESAAAYGLQNEGGYATHAAFFDDDKDGDLDCFIINNSFIPTNTLNYENKRNLRAKDWPVKDFLKGGGDRLLRNNKGKFTDVSQAAGIHGSLISFGLGVTVGDINHDGWLDVYVSNDFFERDYVYINQRNGTYKDEYDTYIQHSSHSSMGADMGDINNDGLPDIFTTEMLPNTDYRIKTTTSFDNVDVNKLKVKSGFGNQYSQNTLQLNTGNNNFVETAYYSGVAASDWSWGGLIFDANNDGLQDIYVCNGIYKDVTNQDFIDFFADELYQKLAITGRKEDIESIINKMPSVPIPNCMFVNNGNAKFTERAKAWGLATASYSNGSAYGDLDNDGDLDLIVNNVNQPCFVYKNNNVRSDSTHSISFLLQDTGYNTFAVGATIKAFAKQQILLKEIMPSRGFQSSVDYKAVIGLGKIKQLDSVQIIWPNGTYQTLQQPASDTLHKVVKNTTQSYIYQVAAAQSPLFSQSKQVLTAHAEDDYTDFYNERNLPCMTSREGPATAVADVNGDGLQDVYLGGAAQQAAQLYLQKANGLFTPKPTPAFITDAAYEDVCATFADVDNDNDPDLIVGAGGNNQPAGSTAYYNRIYINNGAGVFTNSPNVLPQSGNNTSCIIAADFDADSDQDLIISAKSIPYNYGVTPSLQVLVNNGKGNYTNAKPLQYSTMVQLGNITSMAVTKAGIALQLILVGEYMAPAIFTYNGSSFVPVTNNLGNYSGMWQCVTTADVDNDGDQDLLLGNIGENFYLQPTATQPVKLWINDFDNNSTPDKLLTRTVNEKDVPVFTKKDLTDQLPALKKQNLKHEAYAAKTIQQLFTSKLIKSSIVKTFNYNSNSVAINTGNGNYTLSALPWQAQLSCINAILPADVNNDGFIDLLVGGNRYDFLPQFGRLDASLGGVLLNNGKGQYSFVPYTNTGLNIQGCVRNILAIQGTKKAAYIWSINNSAPSLFNLN